MRTKVSRYVSFGGNMKHLRQARLFTAVVLYAATFVVFPGTSSFAVDVKCSTLLSNARESGLKPRVVINDWMGVVTISGNTSTCKEPIEIWKKRQITGYPTTHVTTKPKLPPMQALAEPAPATVDTPRNSGSSDKSFGTNRKDMRNMNIGAPIETRCEMQLDEIWNEGKYEVGSSSYYLGSMFTIDSNHDGITDNVGFLFQRTGKKDVRAFHKPFPGIKKISNIKGLKSLSQDEISLICFGQAEFNVPVERVDIKKSRKKTEAFTVPDLEKEITARDSGQPSPEEAAKAEKEAEEAANEDAKEGLGLMIWIVIGGGVLLLLGGVVFILARMGKIPFLRSMRKRSEADFVPSSEDDDEEDS